MNCSSLSTIEIPKSVASLGEWGIFVGCTNLVAINVDKDNEFLSSSDGVLFNKDMTELLAYPAGKSGDYNIPPTVTLIKDDTFAGCNN